MSGYRDCDSGVCFSYIQNRPTELRKVRQKEYDSGIQPYFHHIFPNKTTSVAIGIQNSDDVSVTWYPCAKFDVQYELFGQLTAFLEGSETGESGLKVRADSAAKASTRRNARAECRKIPKFRRFLPKTIIKTETLDENCDLWRCP